MSIFHLQTPLIETDIRRLTIGDTLFLSGQAFTGRSRIHRYIFDENHILPFSVKDRNAMIHVGPIVIREDERWKLVSFMPTSSLRFEKWGAQSIESWGLRLIIGKTTMGQNTMAAMKRFGCAHAAPQCVSPNLWRDSIQIEGVELFNELGSIEASWQLTLDELGPFIVDIDSNGQNFYESMDAHVAGMRAEVLAGMGVPPDFCPTRLY